jgi:hypothetical protein
MLGFALLAARLAFSMPRDLPANWIFRIVPVRGGAPYVAARRRALLVVGLGAVWTMSAAVFLTAWPWQPAVAHLAVIAVLGLILVELCLAGTQKIPFTCSYLPGKSRVHVAVYVIGVLMVPLTMIAAAYERDALQDGRRFGTMMLVLAAVWIVARWRTVLVAGEAGAQPEFEEAPEQVVTLDVWDSRFAIKPRE